MARRPSFRFPRGGAGLDIPLAACCGVEEKGVKGIYAPLFASQTMTLLWAFPSFTLHTNDWLCSSIFGKYVKKYLGVSPKIYREQVVKKMQAFKSLVLYVLNPFISHFCYQKEEMYAYISHF